jgi:hypothetical protein
LSSVIKFLDKLVVKWVKFNIYVNSHPSPSLTEAYLKSLVYTTVDNNLLLGIITVGSIGATLYEQMASNPSAVPHVLVSVIAASIMVLNFVFYFLHTKLPRRVERSELLLDYLKKVLSNKTLILERELSQLAVTEELRVKGIKSFCIKYFDKKAPGFLNFMESNIKEESAFLYYALSIPKKRELSIDSLRKILLTYPRDVEFTYPLELDKAFANYSLAEIEKVFVSIGDKDVLWDLDGQGAVLVVERLNDLKTILLPAFLQKIQHQELYGFKIKVLQSPGEYQLTSNEMSNCVRSTYNNGNFIVVVEKDGVKTCLEINSKKQIIQMAGMSDSVSPHRRELVKAFKTVGIRSRFSFPQIF